MANRKTRLGLALVGVALVVVFLTAAGRGRTAQHQQQALQVSNNQASAATGGAHGADAPTSSPPGCIEMPDMPNMPDMPGMCPNNGSSDKNNPSNRAQSDAMSAMQQGHMRMMGPHMRMTPPRAATPDDWARADQIATTLRAAIEKYKDYHVALDDGYRIFLPNVPQSQYHFTNYWNGFLEGFTFDPARPSSLLYKKTKSGGWVLTGAMYTDTKNATLDQLNDRVPLGVASWHVHTNLCIPRASRGDRPDWTRFGLTGSISTLDACREAGGRFYPQIFGWMVHVYPFESTRQKIWAQ